MPASPRPPGRPRQQDTATGSRVVERALDALQTLAEAEGLTLSELAGRLDLAASTTHRLLTSLAARRMAETDPQTGAWHVGPGAFRLGAAFLRRGGLGERARPILRALAAETGETAALAVADGDRALIVAQAESRQLARVSLPEGTRLPLHTSALGKALIAHLPLARVEALLGAGPLPALTPASLTDQGDLTADLATIRQVGAAFEYGETAPQIHALAAPVFGGLGEPVAALALTGPETRLTRAALNALAPRITAAAQDLARALGGT